MQRTPEAPPMQADFHGARQLRRLAKARREIWITGLIQMTFLAVVYGWVDGFVFMKRDKIIYAAVVTVLVVAFDGVMIVRQLRQASQRVSPSHAPLALTHF